MISLTEAQDLILGQVKEMTAKSLPIDEVADYVAASDIISQVAVSPFRNSAMDGFAIASDNLTTYPCSLEITSTIYAGDGTIGNIDNTKAMKIMTGAPLPEGFDTVVKFEDTTYDSDRVTINHPIKPGQNVRLPGEDIACGEVVIAKGELIHDLDIGLLASTGLSSVSVVGKPRILILSTGDELASAGQPLKFGQIYDSNSYTIDGMTKRFRSTVEKRSAVADSKPSLTAALNSDNDVIITTGGVSMGERDYLPQVAQDCGWSQLLHKVAIKPGKPIFVAHRDRQMLFGLPGNPLSAAVTCAVMVIPALKKMIGLSSPLPRPVEATLADPSPMKSGRTVVWPGRIKEKNGTVSASLSPKRSSASLSALKASDGLIFLTNDSSQPAPLVKAMTWQKILSP